MNTQQSPLVPQGSFLEQKNRGRARVKIAVFFVLAVHGIGLMALLMQGCRREEPGANSATNDLAAATNPLPPALDATNPPVADTNVPIAPPTTTTTTGALPSVVPPVTPELGGVTEYKVAKGDSFSSIAKKFHVTTKAIADANPGVDSTKLQINQTLKIPAPAPAGTATSAPAATTTNGTQTYTVKSGDNLTKIASQFGVTVKAIMNANSLKSTSIKVGQALKIPAKAGASTAAPATEPVPTVPTPAPTTPQP